MSVIWKRPDFWAQLLEIIVIVAQEVRERLTPQKKSKRRKKNRR